MKLLTYRYGGVERVGALRGDEVIDLSAVAASMLDLIDGGPELLAAAQQVVATAEGGVRWLRLSCVRQFRARARTSSVWG
ncbi:hypothetical protein [Chloroflexus aurantiacus]|uniref:hypothetical protein n=1 Tax=Chloroflexus aurantiacus TaxID=1108 RepID=UPI000037B779|nr:hypothetical protein [Chloroflexus aurantiacus]